MQRRSLTLAWGEISYLCWEPTTPNGTDVVLLHGAGLDNAWLSWGDFGARLAEAGYRVFAPDHPGYGQSPPSPWPHTQARLVDYVDEFVTALDLHDYVIGGLSLGGGMTLGHLLARPGRAKGALLLGSYGLMDRMQTGPLAAPAHVLTWLTLRSGLLSAMMNAGTRNRRLLIASLNQLIRNKASRSPELLAELQAAYQGPASFAPYEQWQRAEFGWWRLRTNYSDRLGRIEVPVLVVHGDRDTGVPIVFARQAATLIPDAQLLEVTDAGHWVQRDRPEVVIPAVLDFLARLR